MELSTRLPENALTRLKHTLPAPILAAVLSILASAEARPAAHRLESPSRADVFSLALQPEGLFAGGTQGILRLTQEGWSRAEVDVSPTYVLSFVTLGDGGALAGTDFGLLRSEDGGATWSYLVDAMPKAVVWTLVAHPDGPILAGTDRGLYRSLDRGASWDPAEGELAHLGVRALVRGDLGVLFAATDSSGIYRSADQGRRWSRVGRDLPDSCCFALAVNAAGELVAGTRQGEVLRLRGEAEPWRGVESPGGAAVRALAFDHEGRLLAGTERGLFRSSDGGATWRELLSAYGAPIVQAIAVGENGELFAGTYRGGVFTSSDGGKSWSLYGVPERIYTILSDPSGALLVGADRHIYVSSDQARTWTATKSVWIRDLVRAPWGDVYAGTDNSGVLRSADRGRSWQVTNEGLGTTVVPRLAVSPEGDLFAGTVRGVFRSTDRGKTWFETGFLPEGSIHSIVFRKDEIFVAVSAGIFRSQDEGKAWSPLGLTNAGVTSLAVHDSGVLLAGTAKGVSRSADRGESWHPAGLDATAVSLIAVHPSGSLLAVTGGALHSSTDLGLSWRELDVGLPDGARITAIAFDPRGQILLGTRGRGLFQLTAPKAPRNVSGKK